MLFKGIGMCFLLLGFAWAADTASSPQAGRRVYTVGVDSATGKLVRVPAARHSRPISAKTISSRAVSEKPVTPQVIEAREIGSGPAPAPPQPIYNVAAGRSFERLIDQVALNYDIHPSFVHAVIKAESDYNPRAISRKGALGLMQLMPQTARRFGVANVFNPAENLEGGVRYLRYLLDLYGSNTRLSLAAYNAGEGAVDRFGGVPPYFETLQYVRRVSELYRRTRNEAPAPPAPAPKKWDGPRIYQTVDASGNTVYTTDSQ